ncbi:MAG: hypothetical protein KDA42_13455 [Planctomycetales bacterium]|nr:hypothetical protein [Planctomycetales bacterium]
MNSTDAQPSDDRQKLRWSAYWLLIALSAGSMAGRILAVNSVDLERLEKYRIDSKLKESQKQFAEEGLSGDALEARVAERRVELEEKLRLQRPFLSSNDRSRFAAVRALVEHGTFAIDEIVTEPGWDTIDMVKHKDHDGEPKLYSSKPALLTAMLAVPYWIIYQATGDDENGEKITLGTHPYEIGRAMLLLVNVLPMILYFWVLAKTIERLPVSDYARLFAMAGATFGTLLTTFAIVLNNHLIAAVAIAVAFYPTVVIWQTGDQRWRYYFVAGLAAAFTAANELPALSMLCVIGMALAIKSRRQTLLGFLPGVAVVAAAFFATNHAAHDSWRPPYAHRSTTDPDDNWYDYSYFRGTREIDSYWRNPQGIDLGEPRMSDYALHSLVGHRGIFSLTPIWILTIFGLAIWLARRDTPEFGIALAIASVSLVCLAFYLTRPQIDRNYGGMASGFRWMFWFAPLWLIGLLPACDRIARSKALQLVAFLLLAFSALSASFPTWNPWTHPWIAKLLLYLEVIDFS